MKYTNLFAILIAASFWLGCSDTDTGAKWATCETTAECNSDEVCAQNECRPGPWVGECDATISICPGIIGGIAINDPETERSDWENGRGAVTRPAGANTCIIKKSAEGVFFPIDMTVEYDNDGRITRDGDREITYEAHGLLASVLSSETKVTYERDPVGRLLVKTTEDLATGTEIGTRYSYDYVGRISRVVRFAGDTITSDTPVEWSEDGLTCTDYNYNPSAEGATITRDINSYVVRVDRPPLMAASPSSVTEYQHDAGRLLEVTWQETSTVEPPETVKKVNYDSSGRLSSVEQWQFESMLPSGRSAGSTIEWEDGWMRRIVLTHLQTGTIIDTVELEGDCWFSADQVLDWTPYGAILGNQP